MSARRPHSPGPPRTPRTARPKRLISHACTPRFIANMVNTRRRQGCCQGAEYVARLWEIAEPPERPGVAPSYRTGANGKGSRESDMTRSPSRPGMTALCANGSSRLILFSNGSRGRGSFGYRRLGMPAFSARSLALDGVSWDRAARLKTQSAGYAAGYKIHAVICSLPRASLLAGARCGLLSQWSVGLRRDERRSVP